MAVFTLHLLAFPWISTAPRKACRSWQTCVGLAGRSQGRSEPRRGWTLAVLKAQKSSHWPSSWGSSGFARTSGFVTSGAWTLTDGRLISSCWGLREGTLTRRLSCNLSAALGSAGRISAVAALAEAKRRLSSCRPVKTVGAATHSGRGLVCTYLGAVTNSSLSRGLFSPAHKHKQMLRKKMLLHCSS